MYGYSSNTMWWWVMAGKAVKIDTRHLKLLSKLFRRRRMIYPQSWSSPQEASSVWSAFEILLLKVTIDIADEHQYQYPKSFSAPGRHESEQSQGGQFVPAMFAVWLFPSGFIINVAFGRGRSLERRIDHSAGDRYRWLQPRIGRRKNCLFYSSSAKFTWYSYGQGCLWWLPQEAMAPPEQTGCVVSRETNRFKTTGWRNILTWSKQHLHTPDRAASDTTHLAAMQFRCFEFSNGCLQQENRWLSMYATICARVACIGTG